MFMTCIKACPNLLDKTKKWRKNLVIIDASAIHRSGTICAVPQIAISSLYQQAGFWGGLGWIWSWAWWVQRSSDAERITLPSK